MSVATVVAAPVPGQKWEPLHPWRKRKNYPWAEVLRVGSGGIDVLMVPCHRGDIGVRLSMPAAKFLRDFRQLGGGQ